jgi:hypothetical protein
MSNKATAMKPAGTTVNGIDVELPLMEVVHAVQNDPAKGNGRLPCDVRLEGADPQRGDGRVLHPRWRADHPPPHDDDEPVELLGTDTAPNPQEMLMAALNACVMVGYVAGAALRGITLETLELETSGELDLRGFLGIDANVKPGYDSVQYTVRIKGQRHARAVPRDPRDGDENLAELLQYLAAGARSTNTRLPVET